MPEKFLILGGSSFYARNFADYVLKKGDEAILCERYKWQGKPPKVDYTVNFASKSLVAESWLEPGEWCRANVEEFAILLQDVTSIGGFGKFVHVSTPEVYGDMTPWGDEETPFNPSTPYAVSRAAGDMMLLAFYKAYNLPALITRTANIYGPGQGANRIIPLAFDTLRKGEKLKLHGGGHTVRSFIHVKDACAGLYIAAKQGDPGHTYHISTTRLTSIKELVSMICRQLGKRPEEHIGSQEERIGKDQTYALNSGKLRRMGWRDTYTLERGLLEYGQGA